MQSRKGAPRVAFGALVEAGLLPPGTELFDTQAPLERRGARRRLASCAARKAGSIHHVGKTLQGAPSCNGWTFWHLEHEGEVKPLDALRQLYLLAVED